MKNIINVLNVNGCKIEDKNDICNSFNNYFATLGDTLVEQLPNPGINTFEDYLPQATKNSIFVALPINMKLVILSISLKIINLRDLTILGLPLLKKWNKL